MKIAIIGYSGSGKSTTAKHLGNLFHLPVLHLDAIHFTAGWQERDQIDALSLVSSFMKQADWIIDGNFTDLLQPQRLQEADLIVFMNFSRWNCLRRIFQRYRRYRGKTRPDMAENCNEKIDKEFLKWILLDGRSSERKAHYNEIITQYPEKAIVLHTQNELDAFLGKMSIRAAAM